MFGLIKAFTIKNFIITGTIQTPETLIEAPSIGTDTCC